MITTRVQSGLYMIHCKGRVFEIEDIRQASDGEAVPGWMLYELKGTARVREFWNDFATLRAAKAAIHSALVMEY